MRQIKVEVLHETRGSGSRARSTQSSKIRLKGRWLAQAGFEPGAVVTIISIAPGELVIRKGGLRS